MEGKQIGEVFNFFEHVGVIAIKLDAPLKVGDIIRIVGGDKDFTEVVDSMQVDGRNVESAKKGDGVGIKVSEKCHKGYKVYKV
jgi:U32 family peptidase